MSVDRKDLGVVARAATAIPEAADIESAVYDALACAADIDPTYIFVSAHGAEITLSGWVSGRAEIARAAEVTQQTKGVQKVRNELSQTL